MFKDTSIIDLGELDAPRRAGTSHPEREGIMSSSPAGTSRRRRFVAARPSSGFEFGQAVSDFVTSISLFIPGAGQMLAGAVTHGLFFLSAMGLLCTLAWAIVETFDRLTGTLDLFDMPRAAALGTLAVLYILASFLHLCGVLHVHTLLPRTRRDRHPAFMALASLLVPGWGQMLNACYGRGTLFLASLWAFGAGWLVLSPKVHHMFSRAGLELPRAMTTGWLTFAMVTAPMILWALAIYDAASHAAAARRRD